MAIRAGWAGAGYALAVGMMLVCVGGVAKAAGPDARSNKVPADVVAKLEQGEAQSLILLFDDQAIAKEANALRAKLGAKTETAKVQALKATRYTALKQAIWAALPSGEYQVLRDYSHLPMALVRFDTPLALRTLLARSDVIAAYRDEIKHAIFTESLPLIGQNTVSSAGNKGAGTTVQVIDTGVNYTSSAFGSCTAPGTPASCRVIYYENIADSSTTLDSYGHGTVVSAIALGVAPETYIAMINVFGANQATTDSLIISAINWGVANQAALNIAAMNMSLGDGSNNTSPCSNKIFNPYVTPIANAKAAGIVVTIASGNNAYTTGISSPACTPGSVSVGAVYDANVGARGFGACSDAATAADQVTCYSNSASYLTMLAPGSIVSTAVGGGDGTSYAAPFVAGAAAVLRSAFLTDTVDQTIARLTSTGKPVTDARNGVTTPRVNLLAAARPSNDAFVNRVALVGNSGGLIGYSVLATKESGEPDHAGNAGGGSVWWKWTAPANGQLTIDTHGSVFDTLLGVYTGAAVNTLTMVAANDNDGSIGGVSSVVLQAHSGVEYAVVVDGFNGAAGDIALNWNFNASAAADLSLTATGSGGATTGDTLAIHCKVNNAGAQSATNTTLSVTLPVSLAYVSASLPCTASGGIVTCALGTVGASTIASVTINAMAVAAGPYTVSGNTSAETPDPNTANNNYAFSGTVGVGGTTSGGSGDTDAPTLPEWAALLMASLLLAIGYRRSQGKRYAR